MQTNAEAARTEPGMVKGIVTLLSLVVAVSLLLGVSVGLGRGLTSSLPVAPVVQASVDAALTHAKEELYSFAAHSSQPIEEPNRYAVNVVRRVHELRVHEVDAMERPQ